jgi:hypothetical protein
MAVRKEDKGVGMAGVLDLGHDPAVEIHQRATDAGSEALNRVLGCLSLTGPAPRSDFFGPDDEEGKAAPDRAGGD